MKKTLRITALVLAFVMAAFSLFACKAPAGQTDIGGKPTPQPAEKPSANITLSGSSITADSKSGISISGSTLTINAPGTYKLTGKLDNGKIVVDTLEKGDVFLVLAGVEITCADYAPIYCKQAKNLYIYLEKGTTNKVTDGATYTLPAGEDEPDAAIFSKDDLFIMGEGALVVKANYNDGITGKDDVNIESGNITVDAVNHGIKGKDSLEIKGGKVIVTATGDGLKSTQDNDSTLGYVEIKGGEIDITAGDEGIQAFTNVEIKGGKITIKSVDAAVKAEQIIELKEGTLDITTYESPFSCTKFNRANAVVIKVNGEDFEG